VSAPAARPVPDPVAPPADAPEHHNDRRAFLVWALMLGAIPPERVAERVLADLEGETDA